jgi:hypothetical protein
LEEEEITMVFKKLALALAASAVFGVSAPSFAATITDPVGDFLPGYVGPHEDDLDITSFSVTFNSTLDTFLIQSTFGGAIDPTLGGFYVIGVDTGTGPANFASIGLPGVKFNQVIVAQKDGTAAIGGGAALTPGSVSIGGNALSLIVPLSLLPSTGFNPEQYGFSIWPRSVTQLQPGQPGTAVISDFAPGNATLSVSGGVPEPAAWALMVVGFGLTGALLRRRSNLQPTYSW